MPVMKQYFFPQFFLLAPDKGWFEFQIESDKQVIVMRGDFSK